MRIRRERLGGTGAGLCVVPAGPRFFPHLAAGPGSFSPVLWHFGVSRIGITAASIYSNLVPVVVVSIAIAAGRYPTVMHLVGGALVIAGVLFAQLRKRT